MRYGLPCGVHGIATVGEGDGFGLCFANEFIVLLKETSVSGYIGLEDMTKGGDIIRSQTFSPFLPLISVALIYLVIVLLLTHLTGKLERRLAANDRR